MNRLASPVVALLVCLGACSKKDPDPAPAPRATSPSPSPEAAATSPTFERTVQQRMVLNPAALRADQPATDTATAVTSLTKENPMWNAPIKTLQGDDARLADHQGKALLLVNVASKCGLTPQYAALEALQKKYGPKGFTVVGFPCNQFAGQEPGSAEEIATFCSTTYGVTFPMMEKIEVNGPGRHPIYQELTRVADASGHTGDIRWNFEKFVISADGTKVTRFDPKTTPDDPKVLAAIEAALPR